MRVRSCERTFEGWCHSFEDVQVSFRSRLKYAGFDTLLGESPSGFCRCSWLRGQVALLAHGAQLTAPFRARAGRRVRDERISIHQTWRHVERPSVW
jgi:hypothetical protein